MMSVVDQSFFIVVRLLLIRSPSFLLVNAATNAVIVRQKDATTFMRLHQCGPLTRKARIAISDEALIEMYLNYNEVKITVSTSLQSFQKVTTYPY